MKVRFVLGTTLSVLVFAVATGWLLPKPVHLNSGYPSDQTFKFTRLSQSDLQRRWRTLT